MALLLEPSIYELTDFERNADYKTQYSYQIQHVKFLKDTLDFIIKHKECDTLILSPNQHLLLCNPSSHPWNQYTKITKTNEIIGLFSRMMKLKPNVISVDSYIEAIPIETMNKLSGSQCFSDYCKQISYVYNNKEEFIVFYGRLNKSDLNIVKYKIGEINIEFSPIYSILDYFNDSLRKMLLMKKDYQTVPSLHSPLPNVDICREYINIRNELIKKGEDRISVYIKIGREVALRNHYHYNQRLSSINSNSGVIRHIFQSNSTPYIYLSIDVRHGNLEVFDSLGHHQDEYTYDNIAQEKQDKSGLHDIII